jgi:oligopeptide transport system substrate-binding protein
MFKYSQETLSVLLQKILTPTDQQVLSRSLKLHKSWVDSDLYREILMRLLQLPKEFKAIRTAPHLSRVLYAHHFFKKKVSSRASRSPMKRHLFVKLLRTKLQFPFGEKCVCGAVVAFNPLKRRELFEEHHILAAARRIIPNIQGVKESFVDQNVRSKESYTVYYELEKGDGDTFSCEEISLLQEKLPEELKGCIEQLVPTTFMRRNEEEMFRYIVALRDQLKEVGDLPQTTISFEEQTQFDLFFTVVVLRWFKEGDPSISSLIRAHHPDLMFIPDRVDVVGVQEERLKKEATVFRLQIQKDEFYRKDRSVNLYKARQYVVSLLTQALGPIRDYNGGLMLKQNEKLEDFFSLMERQHDEYLMENFFYSITPIAMQSILPASILKEWYSLLDLFITQSISHESFAFGEKKIDETYFLHFCSESDSFKDSLKETLNQLGLPSLDYAFTEISIKGVYCFGILYRPSQLGAEGTLKEAAINTLEKWSGKLKSQTPLKLSFRDRDPNLDPRLVKADQSYLLIKMLFEGLMRLGKGGKPYPAIACSCKASHDHKRFVFKLRNSHWSNGTSVSAYDFEYSWKKAVLQDSHPSFSILHNASRVRRGECDVDALGVVALDDYTLEVHLEYPAPYFLEVVSHWSFSLINRTVDQRYPGWAYHAGENFVSNGPFKLVQWHHNRKLTLEKNLEYWDRDNVLLDKIEVYVHETGESELKLLMNGELDFVGRPMSAPPPLLEVHDPNIEQVEYPLSGVFALFFNVNEFPFNHKKLRQAFALALDPSKFPGVCSHDFGKPPFSFVSRELSLHKESPFPEYDPEKAAALFRKGLGEIGYVLSDFPKITLHYAAEMGRASFFRELARMWREVLGVRVHFERAPDKKHLEKMVNREFQMGCIEIQAQWEDPLHLFEQYEFADNILNFSNWDFPAYRELLREGKMKENMEQRDRCLIVAEALLAQQLPLMPLYEIRGNYLKRSEVSGELPHSCFGLDVKDVKKASVRSTTA